MLIICEDCAKRYNIDETRIKGNRARFTCKECRHIIIVDKSDLSRRLLSASHESGATRAETPSYDLLREMEDAADPVIQSTVEETGKSAGKKSVIRDSIPVYFVLAFLAAFLCSSGVLVYLYTGYVADSLRKSGAQAGFLSSALLLLGVCWAAVLVVYFMLARFISQSVNRLKKDFIKLAGGEHGAVLSIKGPREIRELADVLAKKFASR